MADPFVYIFEWDPQKAAENATKHEVGFELAATVFRDPLHVAVVGAAAAADHGQPGQNGLEGTVLTAQLDGIAGVEIGRLVELGVAARRCVGAQAA